MESHGSSASRPPVSRQSSSSTWQRIGNALKLKSTTENNGGNSSSSINGSNELDRNGDNDSTTMNSDVVSGFSMMSSIYQRRVNPLSQPHCVNSNSANGNSVQCKKDVGPFNIDRPLKHVKLSREGTAHCVLGIYVRCGDYNGYNLESLNSFNGVSNHAVEGRDGRGMNIVVSHLLPGSVADVDGSISVGDEIVSIHGTLVRGMTLTEVTNMLSDRSYKTVDIEVQTPLALEYADLNIDKKIIATAPHGVLCISLPSSDNVSRNDASRGQPLDDGIMYQFSLTPSRLPIGCLRGIFATLYPLIQSLNDANDVCVCAASLTIDNTSSKRTSVIIAMCLVGLNHALLLIVPAGVVSQEVLSNQLKESTLLLDFLFGSLTRAFAHFIDSEANTPAQVEYRRQQLDVLFGNALSACLVADAMWGLPLGFDHTKSYLTWPGTVKLSLQSELASELSDAVSFIESADRSLLVGALHRDTHRFLPVGACLFHRGVLVVNHLPVTYLNSVVRFCRQFRLLQAYATQEPAQLVSWSRVYPTSSAQSSINFCGFSPQSYLLLCGEGPSLLCLILEHQVLDLEADELTTPNVDPFYVTEIRGALAALAASGALAKLDSVLYGAPVPAVTTADSCSVSIRDGHHGSVIADQGFRIRSSATKKRRRSFSHRLISAFSGNNNSDGASESKDPPLSYAEARTRRSLSHDSVLSLSSVSIHDGGDELTLRDSTLVSSLSETQRQIPPPSSLSTQQLSQSKGVDAAVIKAITESLFFNMAGGKESSLFHFVHIDHGQGVIVMPMMQPLNLIEAMKSDMQAGLIQSFQHSCCIIRDMLKPNGHRDKEERCEAGIMLEALSRGGSKSKHLLLLQYWVTGRVLPGQREIYVCHLADVPQSLLELAFKLNFGIN